MNREEIKKLEQDIRRLEKRLDKKRSVFDPKQLEKMFKLLQNKNTNFNFDEMERKCIESITNKQYGTF